MSLLTVPAEPKITGDRKKFLSDSLWEPLCSRSIGDSHSEAESPEHLMRTFRAFHSMGFALSLLMAVSGCDVLEFDCPGDVKITVSIGDSTEFDWDPDCEVSGLWVIDQESDEYSWAIEGTLRPFKPPVTYGVRPDGSKTLRAVKTLQPKRTYRVEVFGAGPYGIHTKGKREFTAR